MLFMLGCCVSTTAQQPAETDPDTIQSATRPDSLSSGEQQFIDLLDRDKVWQEATAKDGFDFRVLGRYARDNEYYNNLAERFEQADTTLFGSDFLVLYYGYAYRDEYRGGYGGQLWKAPMQEGKFEEAYKLLGAALKNAPATPHILADAFRIALELERPAEEIGNLQWRLGALLGWMQALGDGSSEAPIPVVNVSDEYTFMYDFLGVAQVKGQSLLKNDKGVICDRMEVVPGEGSYFTGSEIWFDVSFPITMLESPRHWAKKLAKKEK